MSSPRARQRVHLSESAHWLMRPAPSLFHLSMHEASHIESLLEQVQAAVVDSALSGKVTSIIVDCGRLSGVEPQLAAIAFQRLAPRFGLADATLELRETSVRVRCEACRGERTLTDLNFQCAACGSTQLAVLSGDAFILQQIVIETDDSPSSNSSHP